jgi:hypothetical protein
MSLFHCSEPRHVRSISSSNDRIPSWPYSILYHSIIPSIDLNWLCFGIRCRLHQHPLYRGLLRDISIGHHRKHIENGRCFGERRLDDWLTDLHGHSIVRHGKFHIGSICRRLVVSNSTIVRCGAVDGIDCLRSRLPVRSESDVLSKLKIDRACSMNVAAL